MNAPPFNRTDPEQVAVNCPPELLDGKRFVCWKPVLRNGKWTKPPINPYTGEPAESNNPKTWSPIADALAYCEEHPEVYGVGRVIVQGDGYVGIDFDDCLDESGNLIPTHIAAKWLPRFSSYCERSPSGRGVKLWIRGTLRDDQSRRKQSKLGVEVYTDTRYFTLTGARL
jgi:primase-polymerase (primpol)-like protein